MRNMKIMIRMVFLKEKIRDLGKMNLLVQVLMIEMVVLAIHVGTTAAVIHVLQTNTPVLALKAIGE